MQYKTRIQLKSDTEANWNKAGPKQDGTGGFVPLLGELIVYTADATHPFFRLKVGDGVTNVVELPFIDAGTLNGQEVELVTVANFNLLPQTGSTDKLYIDLATNRMYYYTDDHGYTPLTNFTFATTTGTGSNIVAELPNFQLITGATITLSMTMNNEHNATLTVGNATKPIYYNGTEVKANILKRGFLYNLVYDGQVWQIIGGTLDADNLVLPHKLTFGAGGIYQYDGSADVTVPVYTGGIY